MANFDVVARLMADASGFVAGISEAQGAMESLSSNTGNALQKIGSTMQGVGKGLTTAVTTPILGIGAAAIKLGVGFDDSMRRVQAISGATGDELKGLESIAREMGATTRYSASEAAQGLEYMALAGWDTEQMANALPSVLNLAAAGAMDLGRASDIVTDTMSMFGMESTEAARAADVFAAAQSKSNTSTEQLGEALVKAGPAAASAGESLESTSAILGILADNGVKGSKAGTMLSAMFRDLRASAEDGAVAIGDTAVAVYDANGQMRPMVDIIADIESATEGMTDAQRDAALASIFQEESLKGLLPLLGSGTDSIYELEAALKDSNGTAAEMAEIMEGGLGGAFRNLRSALEEAALSIFRVLEPAIRSLGEYIQTAVDWFNSLDDATKENIVKWALIAAAIGPVLIIFGTLISAVGKIIGAFSLLKGSFTLIKSAATLVSGAFKALGAVFTFLMSPIGLLIAGIAAVVGILIYLWNTSEAFRDGVIAVWEAIKNAAIIAFEAIGEVLRKAGEWLGEFFTRIAEADWAGAWGMVKSAASTTWEAVKSLTSSAWEGIKNVVSAAVEAMPGILSTVGGALSSAWSFVWEGVKTVGSAAWEGIKSSVKAAADAIAPILETAGELIKSAWEAIWKAVESTGTAIKGILEGVGTAFESFGTAVSSVIEAVQGVVEAFAEVITAVFDGVRGVIEEIGETATKIGESLKTIAEGAQALADVDMAGLAGNMISLAGGFTALSIINLSKIGEGLTSVGTALSGIFGVSALATDFTAFNLSLDGLGDKAQASADGVSALKAAREGIYGISDLATDFTAFGLSLVDVGPNATSASTAMTELGTTATTLSTTISSAMSAIESAVSKAMDSIQRATSKAMSDMESSTSKALSTMSSQFTSDFNAMKSTTSSAMSAIRSTITSGMASVLSIIRSTMNSAVSAMNSAAGQAQSAGYNMGMGFYNGLSSMSGSIIALARSIANSAAAAMRSALSIFSPSRVTNKIGGQTGQGFYGGLEDMIKPTKRVAEKLALAGVPDLNPKSITGELNRLTGGNLNAGYTFNGGTLSINQQPAQISLSLGNNEFRTFVDDINAGQQARIRQAY